MTPDKQTKIEQAVRDIKAQFGEHAVQRLSEYKPPPLYRTGLRDLDDLLGGGLLTGAMTLFQGNMTCGRVTLAQHILAHEPGVKVYVDLWGTFDAESASKLGVDLERLVIVQPENRLQAVEILGALIQLRIPLIVLDDSTSSIPVELPAHVIAQLAQSGSVLLALPPVRQWMVHAGARLMVEREGMIRRPIYGDVIGYRSRITIIEQRGIAFGTYTTMDILMESA